MRKWNKYAEVDGLMDIVEVTYCEVKPNGKGWHKAPTKRIDWSTVDPNPFFSFPTAHGSTVKDNKFGGANPLKRNTK